MRRMMLRVVKRPSSTPAGAATRAQKSPLATRPIMMLSRDCCWLTIKVMKPKMNSSKSTLRTVASTNERVIRTCNPDRHRLHRSRQRWCAAGSRMCCSRSITFLFFTFDIHIAILHGPHNELGTSSSSRVWRKQLSSLHLNSLHNHRQVHPGVDGTVELEGPGSIEGAKRARTIAVDLHPVDLWCARLFRRFCLSVLPRSIRNNVRNSCIGNQCDALSLVNGDGGL